MCSPACPPSTLQGNSATLPRCIFQMLPRQQHELDTGKKALYCIYIYNIMNRYLNTMNLPFLFVLHFLLKFIFQMCTHNINITTTYITTMYITKPNRCIYVCIIYMYYIYICMYYIYVCMIYIYYIYLYVLYVCMYYIYICIFQGLERLPSLFHHISRVPSLHVISHRHHRQPTQRLFFDSKLYCFAPFFVTPLFRAFPRFISLHFEPPHPPKRSFVRPNRKPFLTLIDWPKHVGHFC